MANEHRLLAQLDPRDAAELERILRVWLVQHEPLADGGADVAAPR
ncbi:MAG: hypothetical protein PGN11_21655 [Quadrisphaera sp.]